MENFQTVKQKKKWMKVVRVQLGRREKAKKFIWDPWLLEIS